jgi:hypothetical protein
MQIRKQRGNGVKLSIKQSVLRVLLVKTVYVCLCVLAAFLLIRKPLFTRLFLAPCKPNHSSTTGDITQLFYKRPCYL